MRLLASARTPATAACLAGGESMLVEQARSLRYGDFARGVAYRAQRADPEGAAGAAAGPDLLPPLLRGAGGGL